jgi:hypothetical protein
MARARAVGHRAAAGVPDQDHLAAVRAERVDHPDDRADMIAQGNGRGQTK